ncbi:hypothetical protein RFI_27370 [Reticulomyxa filosa]|uniref:Uncharacterized protein n=1 Tax=Reticulomyxa filosa TaxID=46433 RepID=X6M7P9_RETFI|nr:hypothetical protein RFI_27370 [Reticulomyxa filosa]|eukprot:ETO10008.1 hypothetical protein RFI_27370 [Reticulomyxa filosa]
MLFVSLKAWKSYIVVLLLLLLVFYEFLGSVELLELQRFLEEGPDTILRLACANHEMGYLNEYLSKEQESLYRHVTWRSLRQAGKSSLVRTFWKWYLERWNYAKAEYLGSWKSECDGQYIILFIRAALVFLLTFVMGPIYFLSRIVRFFSPAIFIIYLSWFHLWSHVTSFQLAITCLYILLLIILCLSFIPVLRIHFLLWHVNPGGHYISVNNISLSIRQRYTKLQSFSAQETLLMRLFGRDITAVVNAYLPKFGDFDLDEDV